MNRVKVYGADWCEDTRRTLAYLDQLKVPYDYINIDEDERAKAWVRDQNGGKQITPTVDIAGEILSEPSDPDLNAVLRERVGAG